MVLTARAKLMKKLGLDSHEARARKGFGGTSWTHDAEFSTSCNSTSCNSCWNCRKNAWNSWAPERISPCTYCPGGWNENIDERLLHCGTVDTHIYIYIYIYIYYILSNIWIKKSFWHYNETARTHRRPICLWWPRLYDYMAPPRRQARACLLLQRKYGENFKKQKMWSKLDWCMLLAWYLLDV